MRTVVSSILRPGFGAVFSAIALPVSYAMPHRPRYSITVAFLFKSRGVDNIRSTCYIADTALNQLIVDPSVS